MEFVSETSNIRNLPIDTTTSVKMGRDETKLFQMNANYKFFIKIARTVGFPFISKKVCSPTDDMEKCL